MPKEKMSEVIAERDELRVRLVVTQEMMCIIARDEGPEAEDACRMPDGTVYTFRIFGVRRSHGGIVLISLHTADHRETFDVQYFEAAATQARHTVTAVPDAHAYRDAFDRLEQKVRKLHLTAVKQTLRAV